MDGREYEESLPKIAAMSMPLFTAWPLGKDRSIIILLSRESFFGLVRIGEILVQGVKGGP